MPAVLLESLFAFDLFAGSASLASLDAIQLLTKITVTDSRSEYMQTALQMLAS